MYALPNKTQHKLIVKVRGGISQKLDNFTSSYSSATNSTSSNKNSSPIASSPFIAAGFGESSSSSSTAFKQLNDSKLDAQINQSPQPVFHTISHGNKHKSSSNGKAQKQYITPEHNEMIKYVQQSWKGVERDYKKSVSSYINNIDLNNSDHISHSGLKQKQQQQQQAKKKTATTSTPLLLSGSYHHTSSSTKDSINGNRQDAFRPFDLETFWGNRILKRLTEEI